MSNTNSSTKLSAEEMLQNVSGYNRDNIKDHNLIIEAMKQYASQQREDEGVRESKLAEEEEVKGFGRCLEKNCKEYAVKDYNGHGHFVCQYHYDKLSDEFDREYN